MSVSVSRVLFGAVPLPCGPPPLDEATRGGQDSGTAEWKKLFGHAKVRAHALHVMSYKHSVLTNWGFYEFTFLRDGPYFFKVNGPLSFKNGLLGPLRLGA